jgi:hypothetical protein
VAVRGRDGIAIESGSIMLAVGITWEKASSSVLKLQ